ncbi:MAG: TonB-dependent receptor plug domain-containing protein [Candidatus Latescibacteria bacterium]|nr:TonB-dependent receptor plug domain-containing protein [Candidatus Latescibacterota bacterium]
MQHKYRFFFILLGFAIPILYGPAVSQETTRYVSTDTTTSIFDEEIILEELVVIGSRAKPRSVVESAVPVDVVTSAEIVKQGEADLQNLVRSVVPSFNVNTQPISDASTLVRPANLRGLAPDHTLVLINGKRRHRSSLVVWHGNGVSDGDRSFQRLL